VFTERDFLFILELYDQTIDLFPPSQTVRFLGTEIEKIKKAIWIFNVTDNVTDIGALREQGINGFDKFIFVCEDTLLGLRENTAARFPELDASGIAAGMTTLIVRAAQMDQVASPARLWIDFLCRWVHSRTKVRHRERAMRLSTSRL
jgi:hypothetical protein